MAPPRQRGTAATWIAAAVVVIAIALLVSACGGDDEETAGGSDSEGGKIALLLPESKTTRYETQDRPNFERRVQELCPGCEVFYQNADQDAAKQQRQVEAAITEGVDVMVLDPVDSASAASLAQRAKDRGIPVVSYDRLITDAPLDYYISFDNEEVGRLQAQSLVDELKERGDRDGSIVMINGAPTDNNATLFKRGAHSVFDDARLTIAKEYDTPDWSPDAAQREMEQAIAAVGRNGFDGVYAANDGTAGGAIAALKGAGLDPEKYPVTGQDAERAAIQRILAGSQYMTVYKAIKAEAKAAAELSVALAKGDEPKAGLVTGKVDNGRLQVPSVLLTAGRGHQGQRRGHGDQGRLLVGRADLHRPLRGRLRGGGNLLMADAMLALTGVTKRFGNVEALVDVDFEVERGEVVALVGDNGAGKSTLVKVVSGIGPADEGEVRFEGREVRLRQPQDAAALGIATVYQDLALCDNLDVVANLFLGHEAVAPGAGEAVRLLAETRMERRSRELLDSLHVTTLKSVRTEVGTLSGGQRQSVAIARSLLGEPSVVLLDEPTAALGVEQTEQVLELVKRLRERELGVVMISHNLADVFAVADRIVVLRLGRRTATFTAADADQADVVAAITGAGGQEEDER